MGSASSRMSASPALDHSIERASNQSSDITLSISPEPTFTDESKLIDNQTSELNHVSPARQVLDHAISPIKLDKGKGKQIMIDKEEGEISEEEEGQISEDEAGPRRTIQHASPLSTRSSSGGKVHYDSYRPTPRGSSRPHRGSQSPKSFQASTQPRQQKQHSLSPLQMQFPQYGQNQQQITRLGGNSLQKSPLTPRFPAAASTSHTPLPARPVTINGQTMTPEPNPLAKIESSPPEDSLALPSSESTRYVYTKTDHQSSHRKKQINTWISSETSCRTA
jgi:hypothetical protein